MARVLMRLVAIERSAHRALDGMLYEEAVEIAIQAGLKSDELKEAALRYAKYRSN